MHLISSQKAPNS